MDLHPRPPLQGGLPPLETSDGHILPVVEIACDESGFSGTNLLDTATPVITHASVDLGRDEAAHLVEEVRAGFPWLLGEFKSGQLLRGPRARESLEPLLAALTDRAHVQVVDKELFLVTRVVDLLLSEPSYAAGTSLSSELRPAALALYRAGRTRGRDWDAFLSSFVELVRTKKRQQPVRRILDAFFHARDALADGLDADAGVDAGTVLAGLTRTRTRAVLARLVHDDPAVPPPLEPMLPALAETVLFWSGGRRQVLVVHDEQSALTATRLRRLRAALALDPDWVARSGRSHPAAEHDGSGAAQVSPLAGLVTVDSRDDPRVQVADILAGVARRSPDIDHDPLLRPFLSPTSLRDAGSREMLGPAALRARP
ncbi:MAG: hypothetical protein HOQ27_12275 [Dermatophilaceae bacterium]|nr:hypothetical protein [Dermatophilaceae bacterium]NUQ31838.1 hypothetical protein [Dermatophilaceae bacterium]